MGERAISHLAPPAEQVKISPKESPGQRLKEMKLKEPPQASVKVVLPQTGMDSKHPPQWTETMAQPDAPTKAPDPFTPPEMVVDPRR